jgi:hypothetical protein
MHKQRRLHFGNEARLDELWFQFTQSNKKDVVVLLARLLARAARAAGEQSTVFPLMEETREEPRR